MTHRAQRPRRGIALFVALVALLLVALLSVASMHLAHADFRRARDESTMRRASNAADAGAYDLLRAWQAMPHEGLPVGATIGPDTVALIGGSAERWLTRLTRTAWWSVSTGSAGDSAQHTLARRTVQVAYRLAIPDVPANAALVARDSVTLAGSARVVGTDTALVGWGGLCAPLSHTAAIAMPDTTHLCDGVCGAGSGGRATGLPALTSDSSAAFASRYSVFGGETWASLTSRATIVVPPGGIVTPASVLAAGQCDRSVSSNWGDPGGVGPCASYAPLIWAQGDVEVRGGAGQGVLLVEGDLTLSAGARFAGVVIVRDDLRSSGIGGTLLGLALAGDRNVAAGDHSILDGQTLVQRSRCAVDLALERAAPLVRVAKRSWSPFR
ncbi:MAG: hypothetical protein IT359_21035 [Gemmatimonadaceae bacterium]|nr:hypothetical protein [Gemmatimonadaceae bacterium]